MADNTGTVKPADFHATSEKAEAPAVVADSKPAQAAGEEITTKDFHATTEPLNKPADFHATDETA
ncbi:hypothetical protein PYK79_16460 [Streptomyces sp. ID05-04B]|uniref:hypothetical protein n=1 Tax=unclassified Streptomyces TaxID=2593676 RepID=UPI000D1BD8FE|nr:MULTISPECIES: hypothetical protein [unclassified Streptomyces]AVV42097.1 hypothetical protein C6376_12315 [Streptomyces sp. P3]MDX5564601.1 hypothetical protein [Streptomyces sp. ID05-04B]